jgi:hypothetical protein
MTVPLPSMKTLILTLLLAATAIAPAHAQTIPSGNYTATAVLGPIYLDGRYPLLVGPGAAPLGRLDLLTSPTGALSGTYTTLGVSPVPITGQITSRPKSVKLTLKGTAVVDGRTQRFTLTATLLGAAFRGTLKLGAKSTVCAVDVTGVGAIKADYALSLLVAANGRIFGAGTATVGRTQIAVATMGSFLNGKGSIAITGEKTFLRSSSLQLDATGFTAVKWTAQGFGALTPGVKLQVAAVP